MVIIWVPIQTERPPRSGGASFQNVETADTNRLTPRPVVAGASVGRWRAKTLGVHREGVQGAAFVSSCPALAEMVVYVTALVRTTFYRVGGSRLFTLVLM